MTRPSAASTGPAPRKAPSQGRSRATVRAILEAAARVLSEDSLEGFNTNRVASVAGVSVGSLYQYFPGKGALIAQLIEAAHETLADAVETAVLATEGRSLREAVVVMAGIAVDQQFDDPLLAAALDHEELRLRPSPAVERALIRIGDGVATILGRHAASLTVADVPTACRDCLAIAKGLVEAAAGGPPRSRGEVHAAVARALLGYLTLPADPPPSTSRSRPALPPPVR